MTTEIGWTPGDYALDRYDRLWHARSWDHGVLLWQGIGHGNKWPHADLERDHGPLRRVQIVEVRG